MGKRVGCRGCLDPSPSPPFFPAWTCLPASVPHSQSQISFPPLNVRSRLSSVQNSPTAPTPFQA